MRLGQKIMGKEFEYACILALQEAIAPHAPVEFCSKKQCTAIKARFNALAPAAKDRLMQAASAAVRILLRCEPKLRYPDSTEPVRLFTDADAGQRLICSQGAWHIRLSCVNPEIAERFLCITPATDPGCEWLNISFSKKYFHELLPIFHQLRQMNTNWESVKDKESAYFRPILEAMIRELTQIDQEHPMVPNHLTQYLLGGKDYYKLLPNESREITNVLPINMFGELSQPCIPLPTKFYCTELRTGHDAVAEIVCDNDWLISIRLQPLHSHVEPQLLLSMRLCTKPRHIPMLTEPWNK